MKLRLLFILISMLFLSVVEATQYRALSLSQQVEEADVFVSGVVTEVSALEREGRIWSKVTVTLKSALNYNSPQIIFLMPGGSLNGRSMKIETVDVPNLGDQKNYLLKKVREDYFLSNLGLAEYSKIESSGKDIFASKIYADMPGLKNLTLDDFKKASGEKSWKTSTFEVPTKVDHHVLIKADSERTLPMVDDVKSIEKRQTEAKFFRIILWVIGFFLLGFILYNMQKKNNGGNK